MPQSSTAEARQLGAVRLLEVDPDLAVGVPDSVTERIGLAPTVALKPGVQSGAALSDAGQHDASMGLFVITGLLTREIGLAGCSSLELLGPGDVLRPRSFDEPLASGRERLARG